MHHGQEEAVRLSGPLLLALIDRASFLDLDLDHDQVLFLLSQSLQLAAFHHKLP